MRKGALEGIRVLDLGRVVAAPICGQILGDLGADVIKVERVKGGDDVRGVAPFTKDGINLYYPTFNRNKRSITIDFRNPKGIEVLRRLIANADVLVENFRPGTMENMGLGYEEVRKINPRMIMASISGFGETGPYRDRAAFDWIVQAMSGFMSLSGDEATGPVRTGQPITDHMTGIYAAVGILGALHNRSVTGLGQHIDMALFDTLITTLGSTIPDYGCNGVVQKPWGNRDMVTPVNLYKTQQGEIYIHAGSDPLYQRLVNLLQNPVLSEERFRTIPGRNAEPDLIDGIITQWLSDKTAKEAEAILLEAGIPCGVAARINDLFDNPQVKARDMIIQLDVEGAGKVPYPGMPIKLSDTPCSVHYENFQLGAATEDIMTNLLGYTQDEFHALRAAHIV
mgnify:FL=1